MSVLSRWYAVRVKPNHEFRVERGLADLGVENYLPFYIENVKWSDRTKRVNRLLFPGYVFVRMAVADIPSLLSVVGVLGVLPSNITPIAIDEEQIAAIGTILASNLPVETCEYQSGDAVRIGSGVLRGLAGVVVRTARSTRLIVSVEILRRAVAVEIDPSALQLAS